MKKGLTLIEISIVLVVIGVLLGLAFKGKSLIDSARLKSDMNKIHKISTGISVYVSANNKLPGEKSDRTYSEKQMFQDLLDDGSITEKDMQISSINQYFHLLPCKNNEESTGDNTYWEPINKFTTKDNICITAHTSKPFDDMSFAWKNNKQAPLFICYIETVLDDKNIYGGDGRVNKKLGSTTPEINDCKKAEKETAISPYFYRVY